MMRGAVKTVLGAVVVGAGLCAGAQARACAEFKHIDNTQVMALLAQVKDAKAPEFDRGFAFETLICDDRPYVRDQAMKEALEAASSPMLRAIILPQVLYQAKTLRLELQEAPGLDEPSKKYIRDRKGILPLDMQKNFPSDGCINIEYGTAECRGDFRMLIRGTKVDLKLGGGSDGVLELKDGGVLVGYFRPDRNYGLIPARISLF